MYSDQLIRSNLWKRWLLHSVSQSSLNDTPRPETEKEASSVESANSGTHTRRTRRKRNKQGNGTESQSEGNTSCTGTAKELKAKEARASRNRPDTESQSDGNTNCTEKKDKGKEHPMSRGNRKLPRQAERASRYRPDIEGRSDEYTGCKEVKVNEKEQSVSRANKKLPRQAERASRYRPDAKGRSDEYTGCKEVKVNEKEQSVSCANGKQTERTEKAKEFKGARSSRNYLPATASFATSRRSTYSSESERKGSDSMSKLIPGKVVILKRTVQEGNTTVATSTNSQNCEFRKRSQVVPASPAQKGTEDTNCDSEPGYSGRIEDHLFQKPKSKPNDSYRPPEQRCQKWGERGCEKPATSTKKKPWNWHKRNRTAERDDVGVASGDSDNLSERRPKVNVSRPEACFNAGQDRILSSDSPTVLAEPAVSCEFHDKGVVVSKEKNACTRTPEKDTNTRDINEFESIINDEVCREEDGENPKENGAVQEQNSEYPKQNGEVLEAGDGCSTRESALAGDFWSAEKTCAAPPPGLESNMIFMFTPFCEPTQRETEAEQQTEICLLPNSPQNEEFTERESEREDTCRMFRLDSVDSGCGEDMNEGMPGQQESNRRSKNTARKMNMTPEEVQKHKEKFLKQNQKASRELEALARSPKINFSIINAELEIRSQRGRGGYERIDRTSWKGKGRKVADSKDDQRSSQSSAKDKGNNLLERQDLSKGKPEDCKTKERNGGAQNIRPSEQNTHLEVQEKESRSTQEADGARQFDHAHEETAGSLPEASGLGMFSRRKSSSSDDSGIANSPVLRKGLGALIDEDLRERIAHPKRRVFLYDGPPKDNILFINLSKEKHDAQNAHDSLIRESDEEDEDETREWIISRDGTVYDYGSDAICTMYMHWGFCSKGDKCPKRHPTSRYPCLPSDYSYGCVSEPDRHSTINPARKMEKTATPADVPRDHRSEVRSYASTLKPKAKEEKKQSYEDMFPALGSDGKTAAAVSTVVTLCSTPEDAGLSIEGRSLRDRQRPQMENDFAIAEAVQAEEFEQEIVGDEALTVEPETDEYMLEFEPDEYEFDAAVSESLTYPQPPSGRAHPTTPIPVWDSGADGEFVDVECDGEEAGMCDVCMDRRKNATLLCGHRFCYLCACQMRADEHQCAICRRPIITVIKTYN